MMDATKRAEYIKRLWNANTADEIASILDEYDAEQLPKKPEPNWGEAPEWANWWAVDEDGEPYWYESRPVIDFKGWRIGKKGGTCLNQYYIDLQGFDWRETLTKRP